MAQMENAKDDVNKLRSFAINNQYYEVRRAATEELIKNHLQERNSKNNYLLKKISEQNHGSMVELTALFAISKLPTPKSQLTALTYKKKNIRGDWAMFEFPGYSEVIAEYIFTKVVPDEMLNITILSTSRYVKLRAMRHVSIGELRKFIINKDIDPHTTAIYKNEIEYINSNKDQSAKNIRERLLQTHFKREIFSSIEQSMKHYQTLPDYKMSRDSMTLQEIEREIIEKHPNADVRSLYIQACWDLEYLNTIKDDKNDEIIKNRVKLLKSYRKRIK